MTKMHATANVIEKLKVYTRFILISIGIDLHKKKEDRRVLEKIIFPFFSSNSEFNKILFVGCDWYTKVYNKIFEGKDFQTMDINPKVKIYGANKHIIDRVENIGKYFNDSVLDLIICNGVWGWGLNEKSQTEEAFLGCYQYIRERGILLLGWDDIQKCRPFPLINAKT